MAQINRKSTSYKNAIAGAPERFGNAKQRATARPPAQRGTALPPKLAAKGQRLRGLTQAAARRSSSQRVSAPVLSPRG